MKYKIVLSPGAVESYKRIPFEERSDFRKFVDTRLTSDPETIDDLAINDIAGVHEVKFELSTGEVRIYYDVVDPSIEILSIYLSGIHTEAGITITVKGNPIGIIAKAGIWETIYEQKNKIEVARSQITAGAGLLLSDLPL
jgi:mRNA-degrading endonuclease RelE of RelBE toxin-antitoxin system